MVKERITREYFSKVTDEEKARICKNILLGKMEMEGKEKWKK